jgi:hypothetical protein
MTDKEYVKSIYPKSICRIDPFGIQFEIYFDNNIAWSNVKGVSTISEEIAWNHAKLWCDQKLIERLEE